MKRRCATVPLPSFSNPDAHDSLAALAARFDQGGAGLAAYDAEWRCVFLNNAAEQALGCSAATLLGHVLWDTLPELDTKSARRKYLQAMTERAAVDFEAFNPAVGRWYEHRCLPVSADGSEGLLVFFHDITARKQADAERRTREATLKKTNARLAAAATTDALTGLANRRAFEKRLRMEWEYTVRYDAPVSLLFVDVDRFKAYNDDFGHAAGDQALRQIAHLLSEMVRKSDMAARFGGEEFVILLPQTDTEGATALAERVRCGIAEAYWPHRTVTVSIGVGTRHPGLEGSYDLISAADAALYHAKRDRNRVRHAHEQAKEDCGRGGESSRGTGHHAFTPTLPTLPPLNDCMDQDAMLALVRVVQDTRRLVRQRQGEWTPLHA